MVMATAISAQPIRSAFPEPTGSPLSYTRQIAQPERFQRPSSRSTFSAFACLSFGICKRLSTASDASEPILVNERPHRSLIVCWQREPSIVSSCH